jgi:hypothetical protein
MISNIATWGFYKDSDVIYNNSYPYTAIPPAWSIGNDSFKATALSISGLPSSERTQSESFFMSIHNPSDALDNFYFLKYPDASLMVHGLLDNGGEVQAKALTEAALRDAIRGKQMGEVLIPTTSNGVKVDSVAPSIFTAAEAIDFTWLLNGMRIDSGSPQAFTFGTSTLAVPNSPDVLPTVESFKDISDWTNPYNSFMSAVGGSAVVTYQDVAGGGSGYGYVQKQVTYDVTSRPNLTIDVGALYGGAQWALKVNDGGSDVVLQSDSSQLGLSTYNLASLTGWSGTKTFTIRLYVIGGQAKFRELSTSVPAVLDDFSATTGWSTSNSTIASTSGVAKITSTAAYGRVQKSFTYNVSDYPTLRLTVVDVGGGSAWSLKVDDGGTEIPLTPDNSSTGEMVYDLKAATGWSGSKTFNVDIYAVNEPGAYLKVDSLTRS